MGLKEYFESTFATTLPAGWEETVVDGKPFYQYYVNKRGQPGCQPWPRNPTSADGQKVPRGAGTHTSPGLETNPAWKRVTVRYWRRETPRSRKWYLETKEKYV